MEGEPLFLSEEIIREFHSEQIRLFGGADGLRDEAGFSSAVASPQNVYFYQPDATLFDLAAAYAYHISMSQAFLDGNKRTALQAAIAFLKINGYRVETDPKHLFEGMLNLHLGKETKEAFASYLRGCSVREGGMTEWIRGLFSR